MVCRSILHCTGYTFQMVPYIVNTNDFQYTYMFYIDTNQCNTDNGGCQHVCRDRIPGYECFCDNGYVLDADKHSCNGKWNVQTNNTGV